MICESCGGAIDIGGWPFCPDHRPASVSVITDDIPGGQDCEHFGPTVERHYSKSSIARRAKELGLVSTVRHIGEPGSDKSSKTSRWV